MATTLTALVARIAMDTSEVEAGSKQVRSDLNKVNGVFRSMETETDKLVSKAQALDRQLERGAISAEDHARAMAFLNGKFKKIQDDASGLTEQLKEQDAVVNRLRDSMQTPYQKMAKDLAHVDDALRRGTISVKEHAQLTRQLRVEALGFTNLLSPQKLAIAAATAALAGMAAAVAAVVKAYDIATDKMAELDPIIKQSKAMGELTENVQSLAFALSESAGMSIDETTQSLTELQKRLGEAQLGTGEAANALKILGLNAADLARQSPVEQFRTIAAELQRVEDATMRAYLADKLFAEQGKKLVNGLQQSSQSLAEAEAQARAFGLTISDFQAAGIEAANDSLGRTSAQINGIITQFSAEMAPAINLFAAELRKLLPIGSNLTMAFRDTAEIVVATYGVLGDWARLLAGPVLIKQGEVAAGFEMIQEGLKGSFSAQVLADFNEQQRAIRDSMLQSSLDLKAAQEQQTNSAKETVSEYDKQVKALKDQIDAAMEIDRAHEEALAARKEMTFVQNEYLTILENQLAEEKAIAKEKEKAAKAEQKRLADLEDLRKRGEEMMVQNDPAKQMEKQLADLNVLLSVLGESFRSTYDREVQKIIKDAAAAKLGDADRPGLIEAGTQAAADVAMQGVFDKQEEQLRLLEEQKLMQQAQLQAQQETNRRLAELGIVGVIR